MQTAGLNSHGGEVCPEQPELLGFPYPVYNAAAIIFSLYLQQRSACLAKSLVLVQHIMACLHENQHVQRILHATTRSILDKQASLLCTAHAKAAVCPRITSEFWQHIAVLYLSGASIRNCSQTADG